MAARPIGQAKGGLPPKALEIFFALVNDHRNASMNIEMDGGADFFERDG